MSKTPHEFAFGKTDSSSVFCTVLFTEQFKTFVLYIFQDHQ